MPKRTFELTDEQMKGFQLGIVQRHPLFIIEVFDDLTGIHTLEIDNPVVDRYAILTILCKWCRHPDHKFWLMPDEYKDELMGTAWLCNNCEKIVYARKESNGVQKEGQGRTAEEAARN